MPDSSAHGHATYKRILAVKLADLGDLLAITPALQALRAAQPSARIDLLAPPSSAGLLKGAPFLDNVITFDKFAFDSLGSMVDLHGMLRTAYFLLRLRRAGYDALAIFHHFTTGWGSLKFAVLSLASGARVKAGLDNGRGRLLTHKVTDGGFGAMHEADYWLSVASLLDADVHAGWRPFVPVSSTHRATATGLLNEIRVSHTGPIVAIHPGAGAYSLARIWPVEGFAEVVHGLLVSHDATVIVLGGPDEAEKAERLVEMVGYNERVLNLAGRTTIHETAALIEQCDLFLGNDSGPMHIAAAVGTPVVAIFGPSNALAWGPYTPPGEASKHTIVARDLPCMPCFYRVHSLGLREGCGTRPCLTGLSASRVLEACTGALERTLHAT